MYQKPESFSPSYGTAGFRANGTLLESTLYRCGMLMATKAALDGKNVGIVITASHNPEYDNGVKLIDSTGDMIDSKWEAYANLICNLENNVDAKKFCSNLLTDKSIKKIGSVFIGRDTRSSGSILLRACKDGIKQLGAKPVDYGLVTTPQLHSYVIYSNMFPHIQQIDIPDFYFSCIKNAFKCIWGSKPSKKHILYVDCANGVGAITLSKLVKPLSNCGLYLKLKNTGEGVLNSMCGADYVQSEQKLPHGFENIENGAHCCSFDGDADRIVFFTKINDKFKLLNGDKIATLFMLCIREFFDKDINIGVVQTAYANGASTKFLKDQNVDVVYTPTGVKHLHEQAQKYDIGIYFESNGHGTMLFDPEFSKNFTGRLLAIKTLMNQNVGDAITNMLLIETLLRYTKLQSWVQIYTDMPNVQIKLHVKDKNIINTSSPNDMQNEINDIVSQYKNARAFVRPSGTENLVRIYCECQNKNDLSLLSSKIKLTVEKYL